MNDLITIVVPVYNVEKYLPHTLESICGQTYTNLQILLIDDGSTDDSLAVCHKWARQDNRIQVYEQENQGVSRTRNKGIQLAIGKYVMFLDSSRLLCRIKPQRCAKGIFFISLCAPLF